MEVVKRLPLGISDFKELIDGDKYFVDKTLIVKEFLEDNGKVVLLPRPRRFGKTLNLSIIRYFLEKCDENRRYLFNGLNIEKETGLMTKQGKYPVIYLTFKDDKHNNFENFIEMFRHKISSLYSSFNFLNDSLDDIEKRYFNDILYRKSSQSELEISLFKLSEYLNKYYNEKVVILIDEYDTPIHEGYFKEYYAEIIGFMRNFLSAALKDNLALEKAMVTGILRIAKESIFSGLNNLAVYGLLSEGYSDKFGFTEVEIEKILLDFNINDEANEFKEWYNGYIFGNTTIYNPWSVLSYISERNRGFMPHWVNTSENSIIKELLSKADNDIKLGLEKLHAGEYIETTINENIVMTEIDKSSENIWSFLLLSGYLKAYDKRIDKIKHYYKLKIPNNEILSLYEDIIAKWFTESYVESDFNKMLKALVIGDIEFFEEYFSDFVLSSFSYFDVSGKNPERVYHAFVLGILVALDNTHYVLSNRESGLGRYDISLVPKDITKKGVIIEFKSVMKKSKNSIEEHLEDALNQIENNKYEMELLDREIKDIIKLAIVFKGKEVYIKERIAQK